MEELIKPVLLAKDLIVPLSAIGSLYIAWWTQTYFPRIYFEMDCRFLGLHDSQILIEVVANLENKGLVPLKIKNLSFDIRSLDITDSLIISPELRGQVKVPKLIKSGEFIPENWEYTFIHPGVKTEYTYLSAIPNYTKYIRLRGWFNYTRTKRTSINHHAARCFKVPILID